MAGEGDERVPDLQGPHGIRRTGTMNSRERWVRFWQGKSVDHLPDYEFGWWQECYPAWQAQGMPSWIENETRGNQFFGLEERRHFPVSMGIHPGFQYKVVEERKDKRIVIDGGGVLCEIPKDGHSTIPHYIKFPVETRADWVDFKKRLDPEHPARIPANIAERVKTFEQRDYPLGIAVGSLFGWIRNWMGFENACMAVLEEPAMVEDMMEQITLVVESVLRKVLPMIQFDYADFWEDMAFKEGPMVSPKVFKDLMVPRYRRITSLLRKHNVQVIYVDCDGDINLLAPMWLEAGVNGMFPLEVQSNTDPVALRKRYGREMLLLGGVNKIKLIEGKRGIEEELARLAPLVEQGLYIPHVDHRCPPDVTYENYHYYLRRKRELFGIPDPWEHSRAPRR